MSKQSIILSAAGLKNIVVNKEYEEFIFKIGDKELKMNNIFAEFISPRVSHIHQSDPTINFLNLSETNDNKKYGNTVNKIMKDIGNENFLTLILNLSQGNRIEIENEEIAKSIRYFSILVNNEEMFNKMKEIDTMNEKEGINIKEVIEEVEFLYEMNPRIVWQQQTKLIDEIATKINQNNQRDLKDVPKCVLYRVFHMHRSISLYNRII